MARRNEVEIFGLSMLDTVTCSLGGAIVLLLFVASQIPPAAKISFVQETAAQSGTPAEDGKSNNSGKTGVKTASAILAVYFEVSPAKKPIHLRPRPCNVPAVPGLRIVELRRQNDIFEPDGLERFGFAVWYRDNFQQLPKEAHCLKVPGTECKRLSYVAGGHYTTPPMNCPKEPVCFRFSAAEQIYELKKCP